MSWVRKPRSVWPRWRGYWQKGAGSIEQWDQEIAVNVRGPFLFAKAAWPWLKKQGGHIINIAPTASVRAWANVSAYHASKWGLLGFSRGLGMEGQRNKLAGISP
jgi:NAD(P)-dependent dehydrogenase (short-subunit alcohol dehydrogenase family)